MSHKPKAIIYARVSTRAQAEENRYSLPQQLSALREYAAREGYEILDEVTDPGHSGATLNRPGLDRVRDLVQGGGVTVVLAQDRDRFAREPALLWLLKQEFAEYGAALRALNDRGDDSPEGQLTEGILDQLARYERAKTAERTRRGRLQRARQGNIIAGNAPPFGYDYDAARTGYVVDEPKMAVVRRVFRMVGIENMSLNAARRALERDHVPTPRGGKNWQRVVLRDIVTNDLYRPHTYEELTTLADEGLLSPTVLSRLDPKKTYGIWWYNRLSDRRSPDKKRVKLSEKPRSEWIAVPVVDSEIPPEWVDAARKAIEDNVATSSAGGRPWPLHGLAYCPCGWRLATYTNRIRKNGAKRHFYVCSRRRHDNRECSYARYHRAENLEDRVRRFVVGMLSEPAVIEEQIRLHADRERSRLRNPDRQGSTLLEQKSKLMKRRERYLEQHAEGLRSMEDVRARIADLDDQELALDRELDALKESERYLADLDRLATELVRYLPHLLDRPPVVREYETVGAERTEDNPLGIYRLAPESIRYLDEEELANKRRTAEEERAARCRSAYEDLGLTLTAHRDGTLELRWVCGEDILKPQVLQERSVSHLT